MRPAECAGAVELKLKLKIPILTVLTRRQGVAGQKMADFKAPNGRQGRSILVDFSRSRPILVDVDGFWSIVVDFRRFSSILGLEMGGKGRPSWADFDRLYSMLVDGGQF